MANWVIRNSEEFFLPMYEYFHRKVLERGFAMADETPLQVLHEPERRAQTKSYMWLFRSGEDGGPPIILYKYSETRAGDNAVDFLHGFKGYLMCDGYSGYNKVPDTKRTACWAHIRSNGKFRLMGSKPRIPCNTRISLAVYFPFYLPYCIVLLSH